MEANPVDVDRGPSIDLTQVSKLGPGEVIDYLAIDTLNEVLSTALRYRTLDLQGIDYSVHGSVKCSAAVPSTPKIRDNSAPNTLRERRMRLPPAFEYIARLEQFGRLPVDAAMKPSVGPRGFCRITLCGGLSTTPCRSISANRYETIRRRQSLQQENKTWKSPGKISPNSLRTCPTRNYYNIFGAGR